MARGKQPRGIDLSDERLDPLRFALQPGPSAWERGLAALRSLLLHPRRAGSLVLARLGGKRVRARQGFAALLGLDHRGLWRRYPDQSREASAAGFPAGGEEPRPGPIPVSSTQRQSATARSAPRRAGESIERPNGEGSQPAPILIHLAPGHTLAPESDRSIDAAFASEPEVQALYGDALAEFPDGAALPLLRPDFDPDYLLSVDYLGPVVALRRSALCAIEPPDTASPAFAAEYLLRIADRFGPSAIRHLPRILSHWRIDTAGEGGSGHRAARLDLVRRRGLDGRIDGDGIITVLRPLPEPRPSVSLIVPTRDRLDLLIPCLDSLRQRTDWPDREILICDNDSRDPATLAYFRDLAASGQARIISCPGPFNFAAMNNAAAVEARGRLLAFVNNDVEAFAPDWLDLMCREALRPEVGAVGARLLDGDGRIQHGGIVLGTGGLATHSHRHVAGDALGYLSALRATRAVSAVTAACLVVEAAKFRTVGGFDADAFAVDFNDVDLCLRLGEAGFRTLYVGAAVLHHHEAASRRRTPEALARHHREVEAFRRRWGPLLVQDPHYHPGFDPDLGTHARLRRDWPVAEPR